MKKAALRRILGCIIGVALIAGPTLGDDATNALLAAASTNGVTLQVKVFTNQPWDQMSVDLTITNSSSTHVPYHEDGKLCGFRVFAFDGEGRPVAFTKKGERLCGKSSYIFTKYSSQHLAHEKTLTIRVRPAELIAIERIGVYSFAVTWDSDVADPRKNIHLIVANVRVEITALSSPSLTK